MQGGSMELREVQPLPAQDVIERSRIVAADVQSTTSAREARRGHEFTSGGAFGD
jgi:hypothetical protein